MVIISTSYLNDLPADIKTALLECAKEYQVRVQKVLVDQNNSLLAQIKTDTEVNDLTAAQKKVFRDMIQPVYDDYVKANGDALIKRIQAMQ
jgi:TRAP-type C4-dicarboxylate transport system substrate-binding protein